MSLKERSLLPGIDQLTALPYQGPTANGMPMFVKCAGPCEQTVYHKDIYCRECRRKSDELAAFVKGSK